MLLRIAGHTIVEGFSWVLDGRTVGEETLVETCHLTDQVRRMGMSTWRRHETTVLLGLVPTQQQEIADAQELQIQQFVFDVIHRCSTANNMGLHRDMVFLLYGRSHSHRTWTSTDTLTFKLSVLEFLINEL